MFKIKHFKTFLKIILFFTILQFGCSYSLIKEQKDPAFSLLVFKLVIPDELNLNRIDIKKNGDKKIYHTEFTYPPLETKDGRKLQIFNNLPFGNYWIRYIFAKGPISYTSNYTLNRRYYKSTWVELDLDFDIEKSPNLDNNGYFEIRPGTIQYAGSIKIIPGNMKEVFLAKLAKDIEKTPKEINKAIICESEVMTGKGKTNIILLRTDHAALIGEYNSLMIEKQVWETFLTNKKKIPTPKWEELFNKRINEIETRIKKINKQKT